jgi:hypothetical protein
VTNDPKIAFEQMRRETGMMLGYKDADAPSLIQNLQIDCVALLRFSIDHLQAEVFAGHDVDLNKLSTSLGMLRQLLPERSLQAPPPLDEFQPGEAEEVEREWAAKIASINTERMRRLSEDPDGAMDALRLEILEAQRLYPPKEPKGPWGSGSPPSPDAQSEPIERADGQSAKQAAATPTPQLPPRETDQQWHDRVNSKKPPSHYLRSAKDEEIARMGAYFL